MTRRTKNIAPARAPRPRSSHARQRQRLIDACISALHIFGPSRTTVEKVVAIAKMSPGIVRFYFDSKAEMLVASLQFLSAEFEERLLVPVSRLRADPVAALERMVDLYLDPEIASPRKVSVWYAFWGEASSRQEYYDICGQKDEGFALLVRELIGRLIERSGQPHLDPDGIALGLIGVLEMLWQDFAFRSEKDIDRPAAKARCMAYLTSIFPGRFAPARAGGVAPSTHRIDLPAPAPEHDASTPELFRGSWQIVAHRSQIERAGDHVTANLGNERILLIREVRSSEGFYWVRARRGAPAEPAELPVPQLGPENRADELRGARALAAPADLEVRAHWQLVAEQWLGSLQGTGAPGGEGAALDAALGALGASAGWSAAKYRSLAGSAADAPWDVRFLAPNQLIERRPDGVSVLQIVPSGTARCRIRRIDVSLGAGAHEERVARALAYLAGRLTPWTRRGALAIAESAQRGLINFGYRAPAEAVPSAVAWLRRILAAR